MIFVVLLSVLVILAGTSSLANSNDMPLSQSKTYQSNWDLSAKYQPDEIFFQDMMKDGGSKNKYNIDAYEMRSPDADNFAAENYGPGKYYEKDTAYLLDSVNNREFQPLLPPFRSSNGKLSVGNNFVPICRTIRKTRRIRNDLRSEYRPETIDEYLCAHPYKDQDETYNQHDNKVCGVAGFHCVQRYANIHVTHRPPDSDTWLLETFRIANGCECMWPTLEHGDIERYHYSKENNTKYRCRPMYSEY
ncbi:uncharacterized protein LOC119084892 isoform X2 [Bradysia coprophila]|uniref:uncharacterized protein LOC119084892 isoform X2 n=1 Tax=Bradysia coprophila TaxID=38358 RepID=UPI00187DAC8E|nr:uncharacterized protein LOC119084892 isoform X2 [Bradysia coprophila]